MENPNLIAGWMTGGIPNLGHPDILKKLWLGLRARI